MFAYICQNVYHQVQLCSGSCVYFHKPLFRWNPDFFAQVSIIQSGLENPPHGLPTVVFSLDDLYLTHEDQVDLATRNPDNPLLQHRGQPSTHDIRLAKSVFSSLRRNAPTGIPQYNKAAFDGQGDRVAEDQWQKVNAEGQKIIRVVLFEGWCVGFRPLSEHDLKQKWEHAVRAREAGQYNGRLGISTLEDVASINRALREYDDITE
jgi:D-glycerate 3-kinase